MTKPFALSFSRLNTFETCAAKFDYLYVTKNVKDKDNEFTLYGTRVHEALEKYGRAFAAAPDTAAAISALENTGDDVRQHFPIVERILRLGGDTYFEHQMAISGAKEPCSWFSPDVWLRAVADVLVVKGDTAWCIDWKTGKPKADPTQLQLFAALIFIHFPEVQECRTSYIWLNHDDATNSTFQRSMGPAIWSALSPRFRRVQEAVDLGVYPTKPSGLCRYCPARTVCSDARN